MSQGETRARCRRGRQGGSLCGFPASVLLALSAGLGACSTAEGTGKIWSDHLMIAGCVDGPYELQPTFFGANPFSSRDDMTLRVQRGDDLVDFSDGLTALVRNVAAIRESGLGKDLALGMAVNSLPERVQRTSKPDPPVTLALYLLDSCAAENATTFSVGGTIIFDQLFSGDVNETNVDDLWTDASFTADMADPREVLDDGSFPPESLSRVYGQFRFLFQRGQPAQPFP